MRDISTKINFKGKDYTLIFNLNVMEEIQNEYGTIDRWGALCEPKKGENSKVVEPDIKALKYGFGAMLNEGIEKKKKKNGTNDPPLTLKQVGRMITEFGAQDAMEALNKTVIESSKKLSKNESSTKSQ